MAATNVRLSARQPRANLLPYRANQGHTAGSQIRRRSRSRIGVRHSQLVRTDAHQGRGSRTSRAVERQSTRQDTAPTTTNRLLRAKRCELVTSIDRLGVVMNDVTRDSASDKGTSEDHTARLVRESMDRTAKDRTAERRSPLPAAVRGPCVSLSSL